MLWTIFVILLVLWLLGLVSLTRWADSFNSARARDCNPDHQPPQRTPRTLTR